MREHDFNPDDFGPDFEETKTAEEPDTQHKLDEKSDQQSKQQELFRLNLVDKPDRAVTSDTGNSTLVDRLGGFVSRWQLQNNQSKAILSCKNLERQIQTMQVMKDTGGAYKEALIKLESTIPQTIKLATKAGYDSKNLANQLYDGLEKINPVQNQADQKQILEKIKDFLLKLLPASNNPKPGD